MNLALRHTAPGSRRIVTGIAVSLALHALFLLAYRHGNVQSVDIPPAEPRVLSILIAPPAPPPPPPPPQAPAPRVTRPTPAAPAAARANRPAPSQAVIAVPERSSAEPAPFVVQQQAAPEPAPGFDMNAAREVARANAHLRDPAREGTALARFPEPPLQTESKLARDIAGARRSYCKDGIPGGLLAPVYLLMKKKDSGCRW